MQIETLTVEGVNGDYPVMTHRFRAEAEDLSYTVELSRDLRIWESTADGESLTEIVRTETRDGVTTRFVRSTQAAADADGSPAYMRLRVHAD